jgi:hypothetical protein
MSRSDYRTLLDHGRKAGLNTSELYRALASRAPEGHDNSNRHTDCNGFVSEFLLGGGRVYHPLKSPPAA